MIRPLSLITLLLTSLAVCPAWAGLLDPTGDDTGYEPPSVTILKCEVGVARNIRKLAKCIGVRCHRKAAVAAVKLRGFSEELCEDDCNQKYHELDFHNVGCDACLDATKRQTVADDVVQYMDDHNGDVFCDGTQPFGNDDTGFVPPSFPSLHCEQFVAKQMGITMGCIYQCHYEGVSNAFGGGTFVDEPCEDRCRIKWDRLNDGVDAFCPPCLKVAQRTAIYEAFEGFIDRTNGDIFCAQ